MSLTAHVECVVDAMLTRLRRADAVTPDGRMAEAAADIEAALTLIERELSRWRLRGLVWQDGEWCCTLGRHPALPRWLDETVEGRHEALRLALLDAIVHAREDAAAGAPEQIAASVPRLPPRQGLPVCCDDFR